MLYKEFEQCRKDINELGYVALDFASGKIDEAHSKIYGFKDTVLYRELLDREGLELSERFHTVTNFVNSAKRFNKVSLEGIKQMGKFVTYIGNKSHEYGLLK